MTSDYTGNESPPDTTPVQLTRMEGVLNLINHQLSELIRRVDDHGVRINTLELVVQRLGDAAVADKITVEKTATALKEASDATVAAHQAEQLKSDQEWSPYARIFAVIAALGVLVAIYFSLRPGGG